MENFARTDLALELKDDVCEEVLEGVKIRQKNHRGKECDEAILETIIDIQNKKGEELLKRPKGRYITIESDALRNMDESIHEPVVRLVNKHLLSMLKDAKKILVVGLGNRAITPDALGPMAVDNLYITRHLIEEGIVHNVRELSALSPGVMAQTGIDTQGIILAMVKEVEPDVVIAIDALAAREPSRLCTTIQLCDTGISPGSGVCNNRKPLNKETLGVKVIAMGVPTVISVAAIVTQCLNEELESELDESLSAMFVTPKDIDEAIKRVSYTISESINKIFEC